MITVRHSGGYGNRFFQIAAMIAHAIEHKESFATPPFENVWMARFFNWIPVVTEFGMTQKINNHYQYIQHEYKKIPYHPNTCLHGYFQSEKYFEKYRDEVYNHLNIEMSNIQNTVSVHVRRGDYLKFPEVFHQLGKEYYQPAIQHFIKKGFKEFIFFSDDIKWCTENFKSKDFGADYFYFSTYSDELSDLTWMAENRHHIIANSTFGWLGAWIGEQYKGDLGCEVVAPAQWFTKDSKLSSKDIIPDRWIQM